MNDIQTGVGDAQRQGCPPVQVVERAEVAATMLQPVRCKILELLTEPDSAAGLARRLGVPRQRLNHHLKELERAGLLELVEERRRGNCVERVMRATARSYLISPAALGGLGETGLGEVRDRLSWAYLLSLAGRTIRELGVLRRRADEAGKRLATFSLETEVRVGSAEALHRFTEELANELACIVARHHDESAERGRTFRLFVGAYPRLRPAGEDGSCEEDAN
jgi:DNA-binding transcriptional ArsR family regulator